MDLSNFTLLKEDQSSYHVGHPGGKTLQVSKQGLSDKAHKLIKKLKVQKFDDGGSVLPAALDPNAQAQEPSVVEVPTAVGPSVAPSPVPIAAAPGAMAEAFPGEAAQEVQSAQAPPTWDPSKGLRKDAFGGGSPAVAEVVPDAQPQAQAAPSPVAAPQPVDPLVQGKLDRSGVQNEELQNQQDYLKSINGAGGLASSAQKDLNEGLQDLASPEEIAAKYNEKDQNLLNDYVNKKIDPDRYIHSMGTGSKIASGIAMILGGMGARENGGRNAAMDVLNKAIDNDIDAQKNDQGKSLNLYKMNREAMKDEQQTNLLTRNQLLAGVQAKLSMAAQNTNNAMAKLNAQQGISAIKEQMLQNNMKLGLLSQTTGSQGAQGNYLKADPAMLVQEMVPKELQPKAYDEIAVAKNAAQNKPNILKAFDQAANENTILRTGAGWGRTPASVGVFQELTAPLFKDIDGTARAQMMHDTWDRFTPRPGDMQSTIDDKRNGLAKWLDSKTKGEGTVFKGNVGVDLDKFAMTSSDPAAQLKGQDLQLYNLAQAHPTDPRSNLIMKRLGLLK